MLLVASCLRWLIMQNRWITFLATSNICGSKADMGYACNFKYYENIGNYNKCDIYYYVASSSIVYNCMMISFERFRDKSVFLMCQSRKWIWNEVHITEFNSLLACCIIHVRTGGQNQKVKLFAQFCKVKIGYQSITLHNDRNRFQKQQFTYLYLLTNCKINFVQNFGT